VTTAAPANRLWVNELQSHVGTDLPHCTMPDKQDDLAPSSWRALSLLLVNVAPGSTWQPLNRLICSCHVEASRSSCLWPPILRGEVAWRLCDTTLSNKALQRMGYLLRLSANITTREHSCIISLERLRSSLCVSDSASLKPLPRLPSRGRTRTKGIGWVCAAGW